MPQDNVVLTFPAGLTGFEGLKHWRLDEPQDAFPLKFLQSLEDPEITFSCMDAVAVKLDYVVPLNEADASVLALETDADAMVLVLVVVPEEPREMTANLAGPLVINVKSRTGVQVLLDTDRYPLKHPVLHNTKEVQLEFPAGLAGFPQEKKFRLFEPKDAYPLKYLQSTASENITFVAIDIAAIKPDYAFELGDEDATALALSNMQDALVLALLVIPEDPRQMTANLAGPLVVNIRTRQGRQVLLNTDQYPLKYKVLSTDC